MHTSHTRSVFANACRSVPHTNLISSSCRPNTAPSPRVRPISSGVSKSRQSQRRVKPSENKNHLLEACIQSQHISSLDTSLKQKADYETLFKTLLENNALLHNEVSRLKREHSKALSKLSHYYEDRLSNQTELEQRTKHLQAPSRASHTQSARHRVEEITHSGRSTTTPVSNRSVLWAKPATKEENLMSEQYETPEEFVSPVGSDDKLSVTSIETYQITYISSSDEDEDTSVRYTSPGMLAVGKMWDNFTVEDFSVVDFSEALPCNFMQRDNKSVNSKSKESSHAPSVTVPKPFKMTVRETNTIRKKNRSMALMENECNQRQAVEETECRRKFHSNPMPASTLLPLYNLMNAKNEQRREIVKKLSTNTLKSIQKPFTFSKRDDERKEQVCKLQKQAKEEEERRINEMAAFKAKPMRSKLFDPEIDEEALEKEEYRKLRIQMRAEKLLADAKAPSSVQLTEARKKSAKPSQKKPKGLGRPRIIRKVPDYNRAYSKFQKELATKKQTKLATISEPFNLHTERRANGRPVPETSATPHPRVLQIQHPSPAPAPHPPQMTETARRRQLLTKEKMAEVVEKEAALEEDMKTKRMKARAVQRVVAHKSSVFDLSEKLKEERKYKADEFK